MKKKTFNNEYSARAFAEKVGGKVRMQSLPDYMGTIIIWVVEWND